MFSVYIFIFNVVYYAYDNWMVNIRWYKIEYSTLSYLINSCH